jgi:hypothetical protein
MGDVKQEPGPTMPFEDDVIGVEFGPTIVAPPDPDGYVGRHRREDEHDDMDESRPVR